MVMTLQQQISQEKERIGQRLAKLQGEYEGLEAAERVLKRHEKTNGSVRRRGRPAASASEASPKTNMAKVKQTKQTGPNRSVRRRGRPTKATTAEAAKVKRTKQVGPSLSDRVLQAATGIPRSELKLKGARPNHIGMAISRHIRAGRMVEQNGKLYRATQEDTSIAA